MFNLFSKKTIIYEEYNIDELFNNILNDITDIKLINNNLKDENIKLKYENTKLKDKFDEYKKICLYNNFHINKNIFSNKFNKVVEFNKLILSTLIHTERFNILLLKSSIQSHLFFIEYEYEHERSNNKICINLYYNFIMLLKKYNFIKLFIDDDKNILCNRLYDLIIIIIIKIEKIFYNFIEAPPDRFITYNHSFIINIINDCKIIYNNYENKTNNYNINIQSERQYFSKILNELKKILSYRMNVNDLVDFKYNDMCKLYNKLF